MASDSSRVLVVSPLLAGLSWAPRWGLHLATLSAVTAVTLEPGWCASKVGKEKRAMIQSLNLCLLISLCLWAVTFRDVSPLVQHFSPEEKKKWERKAGGGWSGSNAFLPTQVRLWKHFPLERGICLGSSPLEPGRIWGGKNHEHVCGRREGLQKFLTVMWVHTQPQKLPFKCSHQFMAPGASALGKHLPAVILWFHLCPYFRIYSSFFLW